MSDRAGSEVFREVNERIAQLARGWSWSGAQGFMCECAAAGCMQLVLLTREEYERVRAGSAHFLTAPGHRAVGEHVVESYPLFVVVERVAVA
ncbi:MAG: hypothetical protein H0T13_05405 [Actinobacteria bacterium]|nr:hypothetical protein [Actinomycetota bacterium]